MRISFLDRRCSAEALRTEVRALLCRYYERFPEEFDRHAVLVAQLQAGEDISVRSNMRGHVTTSATVLSAQRDKVLLIHHRVFHKWLPPGGHYEAPGSLWDSALRETVEETGVRDVAPHSWTTKHGIAVDIDSHPIPENTAKGEGAHLHHDFRFLASASDEQRLIADLSEVNEARWAAIDELRDSPDDRVRALHAKLVRLGIFG